jgi:PadR family transcriptional regulator PadR
MRFEKEGLLTSEWEEADPQQEGRPRRRLYRITGAGQRLALSVAPDFQVGAAA